MWFKVYEYESKEEAHKALDRKFEKGEITQTEYREYSKEIEKYDYDFIMYKRMIDSSS
jgi:hypothetical protein